MPEIKHNFTGGKMNKDVDERLVPKGQYRDAMNIQVSTSEGSDVGAVQNILGNSVVVIDLGIDSNSKCVGAISDEKNDALYWFVREPETILEPRDIIFELKNNYVTRVFVDYKVESGGVLKFPEHTITGINIIDDMLFWTDGHYDSNGELIGSEPKKINITRSIEGTFINGNFHTRLINPDQNINFGSGILIQEKHITVIKENPKMAPSMILESTKPVSKATMGECEISFEDTANNPGELLIPGDTLVGVPILHSVTNGVTPGTTNNLDVEIGDVMSLEVFPDEESNLSFPLREPVVTANVVNTYISGTPDTNGVFTTLINLEIVSISPSTPLQLTRFLIDLKLHNNERILKFKFPKFAVRYKYQDNEYSGFSPFTQVAFVPLTWDYQPKKGQNIGMQNHLKQVILSDIVPNNIPQGVVQVDILYKESGSSNIYLVDQIKPNDNSGHWANDSYVVDSELIHAVVAENQILRHYDNVPKIARAQEVTGSRIVYGNYKQNYTILDEDANVGFDINLVEHNVAQDGGLVPEKRQHPHFWNPDLTTPLKSIKSLREYQFGVVFEDKYGRQSPVMTSSQSTLKVPKEEAKNSNLLEIKTLNNPPGWAESFRFFIKEPSTEYYNLAMDRWYDAEDGNVWLSFPSLDRNKLTEEDTIILKKNINSNVAIEDTSEYKVIAISNEVPDYVKSTKVSYGTEDHSANTLLGSAAPVVGAKSIYITTDALTSGGIAGNGSPLIHAFEDWKDADMVDKRLWIRFRKTTTPQQVSKWYEVVTMDNYTTDTSGTVNIATELLVRIHSKFQDDIAFVNVSGGFVNGAALEIARSVDTPYAQFDGRFFVKILKDLNLEQSILTYEYDAGYDVIGMLTPRFLRYDGLNHQNIGSYSTGTYDIGSLGSSGDYQVWNNTPMSGGWQFPPTTENPAWYDYNGVISTVGNSGSYRSDESFQNPKWSNSSAAWAYSRGVATWSHGKDINGDDKPTNIFPKSYPYMLGAFNGNWTAGQIEACISDPSPVAFAYEGAEWDLHYVGRGHGEYGSQVSFWHEQGLTNNWFIDMEPTWYFPEKNWNNGVEEYYATPLNFSSGTPAGFNNFDGPSADPDLSGHPYRGHRNTPGVGARLGSRRMDISYVGPDYIPTSTTQSGLNFLLQPNIEIHDFLTSSHPYISFNGDPGMIKYKIVDYRIVEEIANIPDDSNCSMVRAMIGSSGAMDYATTPGLWRVRYELLLDQPIGTTVQDQGIITPSEYILAGGTPDQHNNLGIAFGGDHCCNGTPVYARKYKFYPPNYTADEDQLNDSLGFPGYNDYSQIGVDNSQSGCYNDQLGITTLVEAADQSLVKQDCRVLGGAFYDQVDPSSTVTANTYLSGSPVLIDHTIWKNADGSTRLGYIPTQAVKSSSYATLTHDVAGGNLDPLWTGDWAANERTQIGVVNWSIYGNVNVGSGEYEASYNPAIWETLPTDPIDLELYYEASKSYPMDLFKDNSHLQTAPVGSRVSCYNCNATAVIHSQAEIQTWTSSNTIHLSQPHGNTLVSGDVIQLTNLDGSYVTVVVDEIPNTNEIKILPNIYNSNFGLSWHNCFSFGNGVESDRISDTFNSDRIGKGVKVSTVLEKDYKEEHRKYGLIYSGLYNSTSGVNNLNQFIAAEKITKDINPIYGSIQKLHSRDTDLITLCEDKVLKILANKDAVFNADGNMQLTATKNVLGQTVPFIGEYGISKNPESFASESYRAYFTDKVRGAVIRLSKDGLTPISDAGMRGWFRDNLKLNSKLVGGYDDKKDEYNITLENTTENDGSGGTTAKSVSFKEDTRGWVSFKSFVPENSISCANEYYTFKDGQAWQHHLEVNTSFITIPRNQFYGEPKASSISFYLNDFPSVVKSFHTLNYEGSTSRVIANFQDNEYYNLQDKYGWYVNRIETDKEAGTVDEFIEKEGKWFNYIKGDNILVNNCGQVVDQPYDQASFAMQGLGILKTSPTSVTLISGCTESDQSNYNPAATYNDGSCIPHAYGCIDQSASNYDQIATTDDLTCIWEGCFCDGATYPDGCINTSWFPPIAYTYNSGQNIIDDGNCTAMVEGCMDCGSYWESINPGQYCYGTSPATLVGAFNYNPLANTETIPTACVWVQLGCLWDSAFNTSTASPPANVDPGYCQWYGCTNPNSSYYGLGAQHGSDQGNPWPTEALNYVPFNTSGGYGMIDDGSCTDIGCTDSGAGAFDASGNAVASTYPGYQASNYDATMNLDDGTCTWDPGCTISFADNFSPTTPPGSSYANNLTCQISGCMDVLADNYNCNFTENPNSPIPCSDGVTYDDNSCIYPANPGCTDPAADNYDGPNPPYQDNGSCQYCSLDGWYLSNATSSTIDVTIDPSSSSTPNDATVLTADIKWRVVGTSAWTGPWTINPVDNTAASTHTIMGLIASTAYEVEVAASCANSISYPNTLQTLATSGNITGCMDGTLNNDGSYAAANYNEFANISGPCDPYNCPTVYDSLSSSAITFIVGIETTTYASTDLVVNISYVTDTITTATSITSSLTQFGTWGWGQSITFADMSALVNTGDTFISITSDFNTTDSSCAASITKTLFGGCTDNTMFNYNANADFNNGTCVPYIYGCTDLTACNPDCDSTANPGSSSPCTDGVNTDDNTCIYGTATLYYANSTSCYIGPSCDPGNLGTSYTSLTACCSANPSLCV